MNERQFTISNSAGLTTLSVWPGKRSPGQGPIVLQDESLPEDQRTAYAAELNRAYYACGCTEAAQGMLLGLVGAVALVPVMGLQFSSLSLLALPVVGLVIGKFAGLARAERRLKQTVKQIISEWQPADPPKPDHWACG